MPKQHIILKADDVRYDPDHILPPRWLRFVNHILECDIAAGLGVIGNSLEGDTPDYFDRLRDLHADPHFELWNHGYDHVLKGTNAQGEIYHEFFNTSPEHQCDHLSRTQKLAREKLGVTLHTFGAPGNGIDDVTCQVIDKHPDIQVWLYGHPQSKKHVLKRSVNAEYPTHNPDFPEFATHYDPNRDYLVLQLHPNSWDEDRFAQFTQITHFLIDKGCRFVTPFAYHQSL